MYTQLVYTEQIHIRLTESEANELRYLASRRGKTVSELVRSTFRLDPSDSCLVIPERHLERFHSLARKEGVGSTELIDLILEKVLTEYAG